MRALAIVLVALAIVACGARSAASPPPPPTGARTIDDAEHGLSFTLPAGWRRAPHRLTPHLVSPREILSAGTFAMRPNRGGPCAQQPVGALRAMGPRDAFLTLQGADDVHGFPRRPRPFTLGDERPEDCLAGRGPGFTRWIAFRDGRRAFYALVALGDEAPPARRREVLALLDSLTIDGWCGRTPALPG